LLQLLFPITAIDKDFLYILLRFTPIDMFPEIYERCVQVEYDAVEAEGVKPVLRYRFPITYRGISK